MCKHCNESIPSHKPPQTLYCSPQCQRDNHDKEYRDLNPHPKLAAGTIGAIGEYRVILDLLAKGFDVFHAVSPSCSCDLAVLKNGKLFRIEVRTGHYVRGGKYYYTPSFRTDIMAIVLSDKIAYHPPLE